VSVLADAGLVPHTYVMGTRGRKTGALHSNPVTLVETGGQKRLVAPYGPVAWVLNARAAGRITLRRGGRVGMYAVRELPDAEAGPVLKEYLQIAGATRPYFRATTQSPVADFVAEARAHPVFALTLVDGPGAG
jgi:deazaflavin-dependent oxidoreductase (nitroreductase family)